VGFVPNSSKVNQDRACEHPKFGNDEQKAFFGVFDGHGALGHKVSQYVATELPKVILAQPNLDAEPQKAITHAFVTCNSNLAKTYV
jgi:serine/threonine protein phosphatase PrpC